MQVAADAACPAACLFRQETPATSRAMLHLCKLAVGVRDVAHLRELQSARAANEPPLRHRTRNFPRRASEIAGRGSLYWVVKGAMVVRQPVLDIREDCWDDGTRCTALMLDPGLVPVSARLVKAFQGWRYLEHADAPSDIAAGEGSDDGLPESLRLKLRELCLI